MTPKQKAIYLTNSFINYVSDIDSETGNYSHVIEIYNAKMCAKILCDHVLELAYKTGNPIQVVEGGDGKIILAFGLK